MFLRPHGFLRPDGARARFMQGLAFCMAVVALVGAPTALATRPYTIVLDPGHGGNDHGARAFGMREADLSLDIAIRTRRHLMRQNPGLRVLLTREEDLYMPLEARTAFANVAHGDLFVSIHLNAAWDDVDVSHGGIATFVLDTTNDAQARRLAARENGIEEAEVSELSRLLADVSRSEQRRQSRFLATCIQDTLLQRARRTLPELFDRQVRSAAFRVLVGAHMPAVLVETAFLTVDREATELRTPQYRDTLARGVADGVLQYHQASRIGLR